MGTGVTRGRTTGTGYVIPPRQEQKGRPKSVKKPYKRDNNTPREIWTAGDTSTGRRRMG